MSGRLSGKRVLLSGGVANIGLAILESLVPLVIPLGRQAGPREVAPLFVYLASDEASYVTAQAINVDGGIYN